MKRYWRKLAGRADVVAKRARATTRHRRAEPEPLETRTLLSTIVWTNRGQASDGFQSVFGVNANAARAVIDADIAAWASLITSFNYEPGHDHYDLTVSMAGTGTSSGASGKPTAYAASGKPFQGALTIGRGGDTNGDGLGDGNGYYVDPAPADNAEFNLVSNAYSAYADFPSPAYGKNDLYELCLHEIGHCMGLTTSSKMNAIAVNTGYADNIDGPGIGTYWAISSGAVHTLFTGFDSGGGGVDFGGPVHYAPAGAVVPFNGYTYYGTDDVMNAYYTSGQRRIISSNDINTLSVAYGYTVGSAFDHEYYDRLDGGVLRISGTATGSNTISLTTSGGTLFVDTTLGNPAPGVDPFVIHQSYAISAISSVAITTGAGADTINITPFSATIPITVNGQGGNDTLNITGVGGGTTVYDNSVVGDAVNIAGIYNIRHLAITGTASGDSVVVASANYYTDIGVSGLGGNDSISIGAPFYAVTGLPPITYNGGAGVDAVTYNNVISTHDTVWQLTQPATVAAFDATYSISRSDAILNAETLNIFGGSGIDIFECYAGSVAGTTYNLSGGGGNDEFDLGNFYYNDGLSDFAGTTNIFGGPGNDAVDFNDAFAPAARTYTLTASGLTTGHSGAFNFGQDTETVELDGPRSYAATTYLIPGLATDTHSYYLTGGNADDTFSIQTVAAPHTAVFGGAGTDGLVVDDSSAPASLFRATLSQAAVIRDYGNPNAFTSATVTYSGIELATYYAPYAGIGEMDITGLPAFPINRAWSVFGGAGGPDFFRLSPFDAGGNPTFLGALDLFGQGGTDQAEIDGDAAAAPLSPTVSADAFGTMLISGYGAAGVAPLYIAGTTEYVNLTGSQYGDTFTFAGRRSSQNVTFQGNAGDDTLEVTPATQSLTNITTAGDTYFLGGDGYDTIYLHNEASAVPWTYTRRADGFIAQRNSGGASAYLGDPDVEAVYAYAGPGDDSFSVQAVNAGEYTYFDGGAGADYTGVTSPSLVQGQVVIVSDGGDAVAVDDTADTVGRTLHIADNQFGADPADTLFGPGGFITVLGYATNASVYLGSGSDTVYAAASAYYPILVDGGDPDAATDADPGDTLTLDLGNTLNPLFTPSGGTQVTVSSDNNQNLYYQGFENDPSVDVTPPVILTGAIEPDEGDGVPDLAFTVSEPLPAAPDASALTLVELSTGAPVAVDPGLFVAAFDFNARAIRFTFPGFAGGALPAGLYSATLSGAGVVDRGGNAAGDFTFTFLYVPAGGSLTLAAVGNVYRVQQVAVDPSGYVDITDNSLIVDYDAASPLADVTALLASGYQAGTWSGLGINSSLAAGDGNYVRAIGVAEASDLFDFGGSPTADWQGQAVDATSVLIRPTFYGDTDLSGRVDGVDYANMVDGLNAGVAGWVHGDSDYDGVVTETDRALLLAALRGQDLPQPAPVPAARPSSLAISGVPGSVVAGQRLRARAGGAVGSGILTFTLHAGAADGTVVAVDRAKARGGAAAFAGALTVAGQYTLVAVDGAGDTASETFTVLPAGAARLVWDAPLAGGPAAFNVTARVQDRYGNLVDTGAAATLVVSQGRKGPVMSVAGSFVHGVASFSSLPITGAPQALTLRSGKLKLSGKAQAAARSVA